jgi:hypothetical protein
MVLPLPRRPSGQLPISLFLFTLKWNDIRSGPRKLQLERKTHVTEWSTLQTSFMLRNTSLVGSEIGSRTPKSTAQRETELAKTLPALYGTKRL